MLTPEAAAETLAYWQGVQREAGCGCECRPETDPTTWDEDEHPVFLHSFSCKLLRVLWAPHN